MNDVWIKVLTTIITAVIIPLVTLASSYLIKLIRAKTKNEKAREYLELATNIVTNAVRAVFQSYVENLKKDGKFDKESQLEALKRAKNICKNQIGDDLKNYIDSKYGGFDKWLTTEIESTITQLKNI